MYPNIFTVKSNKSNCYDIYTNTLMIFSRALCNSGHQEDRRDVVKDFQLFLFKHEE